MKIVYSVLLALLFGCVKQPAAPEIQTATAVATATSVATSTSTATQAPLKDPGKLEAGCPAKGVMGAVDISMPVTQHFLDAMAWLGVKTVVRYYEYDNQTIKGKLPSAAELKLIAGNGFSILGVFQHNNSSPATFTADRGNADAQRSVYLAGLWGQPKGSAIYFGVDFEPSAAQAANVDTYAANFSKVARAAGFKVGVYGSGDTLRRLKAAGLVDYTWVSQSTGFAGTKAYTASKAWALLQGMPKDCGGLNVDFDQVGVADFGQWKPSK